MGDVRDGGSVGCPDVQIQPDAVVRRIETERENSDCSCAVAVYRSKAGRDTVTEHFTGIMKSREGLPVLARLVRRAGTEVPVKPGTD